MRSRLTFANVTSVVALFVALGGSSYAAIELSKGSVETKHLAKGAVISKKVKDGSLLSQDFKAGQLPAGAQGPQGEPGPKGDKGSPGTALAYARVNADGSLDTARSKNVKVAKGSVYSFPTWDTTGRYCFDLPAVPHNAVATPEYVDGGRFVYAHVGSAAMCPTGYRDAWVVATNAADDFVDAGFFAAFN